MSSEPNRPDDFARAISGSSYRRKDAIVNVRARFAPRALAVLAALAFVLLAGCTVSFNTGDGQAKNKIELTPGEPAETEAATKETQEFLRLVDAPQMDAAYAHTGEMLRKTVSQAQFKTMMLGLRSSTGGILSRTRLGGGFSSKLEDGVPPGRYCVVFFSTKFEFSTMQEKVVLALEGGQWRVVGYWLQKDFDFKPSEGSAS